MELAVLILYDAGCSHDELYFGLVVIGGIGWGMKGEYQLLFQFGSESALVFDVNEDYEMVSTNNSFQLWTMALNDDGESYSQHAMIGSFTGGGVLEYAGEMSSEDEWPF